MSNLDAERFSAALLLKCSARSLSFRRWEAKRNNVSTIIGTFNPNGEKFKEINELQQKGEEFAKEHTISVLSEYGSCLSLDKRTSLFFSFDEIRIYRERAYLIEHKSVNTPKLVNTAVIQSMLYRGLLERTLNKPLVKSQFAKSLGIEYPPLILGDLKLISVINIAGTYYAVESSNIQRDFIFYEMCRKATAILNSHGKNYDSLRQQGSIAYLHETVSKKVRARQRSVPPCDPRWQIKSIS